MTDSSFYIRFFNEINDRIDFNYNNPIFDWIDKIKNYTILGDKKILESIANGNTPESLPISESSDTVLFIKNENVKEQELDLSNRYFIFKEDFESREESLKLRKNDILLSMTGTLGNACLYTLDEDATINQNIVVIRFKKNEVSSGYVCRLLNTNFVRAQVDREFTSPQTPYINTDKIKSLKLKIPSLTKQEYILEKIKPIEKKVADIRNEVDNSLKLSEKILLSELGIDIFKLKKIDYYYNFVDDNERLDFEYNNPKYDVLYDIMKNSKFPVVDLDKCVDFLKDSRNPLQTPDLEFEYVDIGNIDTRFGEIHSTTMIGKDATSSRMRRVIYKNNILVSTTRPTRNAIVIVPSHLDNQICSTGFGVLKCKENILTDYLFLYLRSRIANYQFQQLCSGSGYPEINQEKDLPKLKVIKPDNLEIQKEIIKKSFTELNKAKDLNKKVELKWNESKELFEKLIRDI